MAKQPVRRLECYVLVQTELLENESEFSVRLIGFIKMEATYRC